MTRTASIVAVAIAWAALLRATLVPAGAITVAPPPCTGALPLYTRLGTLANLDGTRRRPADIEARLEIIRLIAVPDRVQRVGWAYVDGEGDVWISFDANERAAVDDWRRIAPGLRRHNPAYALIDRYGIPRPYRFAACSG